MRSDYVNVTEIRVGDIVAVLSGKDAGKRGKVERLVAPGRLIVEGLNIAKKHTKPRQKTVTGAQTPTVEPGGIFDVAKELGFPFHDTGFGTTLALWGANEGPFLFLPILGPSQRHWRSAPRGGDRCPDTSA